MNDKTNNPGNGTNTSGGHPLVGDEIRILRMEGEPQYEGKTGTVELIDDAGQIHGTWGGCALIPGVDSFETIHLGKEGD